MPRKGLPTWFERGGEIGSNQSVWASFRDLVWEACDLVRDEGPV